MTVTEKDSLAVEQRVGSDSMVTEKKADSIQSVDIKKDVNTTGHSHSNRPQRIRHRN